MLFWPVQTEVVLKENVERRHAPQTGNTEVAVSELADHNWQMEGRKTDQTEDWRNTDSV